MDVPMDRDLSPKAVSVAVSIGTNNTEHYTEVHHDYRSNNTHQ
jgi:hypothetical protein